MDRIRQVYQSLSKTETKNLKLFLEMVHSKGENKPLELVRMLEKKPELLAETASEKLYGDPKSKAFIMMKSRLYERMLDFLCFWGENESFPRAEVFYGNNFRYRKATLQATVLRSRKLKNLALPLWQEAIEFAQLCCAPEWATDGLIQIRNGHQPPSLDEFEQLSQQLALSSRQTQLNLNAAGLYGKFLYLLGQREFNDKPYEFLARNLPDLETELQDLRSPRAEYYRLMMRFHLSSHLKEFEETKSILQRLILLLQEEQGLLTDSRVHEPTFQLGIVELKMLRFDAALDAFRAVIDAHAPGERMRERALTMSLFPMIATRRLDDTAAVFGELESSLECGRLSRDARYHALFLYLKSCMDYLRGNLRAAWNGIQDAISQANEQMGVSVCLKLFEVMVLVERGMHDIASQRLESLRKHIARYGCEERSKLMFRLLTAQEKRDFGFREFKQEKSILDALQSEQAWDPSMHELIRFDDWYRERCRQANREM